MTARNICFFVELAVIFTKSQETGQLAVVLARPRVLFITRGLDDRELTPDQNVLKILETTVSFRGCEIMV